MTRAPARKKRKAWRYGRFAEALAAWHLRARGYRIVSRGFRSAAGEIDIVARRGQVLAFVEVKARRELMAAAESLGPRQAGRIARAASAYLQSRPALAVLDQRFDVMLVRPWRLPVHLKDAWRPEG